MEANNPLHPISNRSTHMATKTYSAGVKEYRGTYWEPHYTPKDTDILACFKITPQAGVDREELASRTSTSSRRTIPSRSTSSCWPAIMCTK